MNIRWLFSSLRSLPVSLSGTSPTSLLRPRPHKNLPRLSRRLRDGMEQLEQVGCNVSDKLIRENGDAVVSSGHAAAGYQYVNIDDCWQVSRDASGTIVAIPQDFRRESRRSRTTCTVKD